MESMGGRIREVLDELASYDWVEAAAVIRNEGILVASNFPTTYLGNEIFAMMSATILGAAQNMSTKSDMGPPMRVIIETGLGTFIIQGIGSRTMVVCLVKDGISEPANLKTLNSALDRVKGLL
jgi:predicted regulator of Ras-like GTPase activity (Roadblock/LC7/MglB family)